MKIFGILVGAALMLAASAASAACNQWGNCTDGSGGGYNARTGRSWHGTTDGSGSTGYDSRGNYYQYDRSTGQYYNFGTGEMRSHGRRSNYGW